QEEAGKGHTWSPPIELLRATFEFIPNVDKSIVGKMLVEDTDTFYMTEDKSKISLTGFQRLEDLVAKELHRILKAKNDFDYKGWEVAVDAIEELQGWKFTGQQRNEA
ncbi:AAA family ATPase, partial [Bacillus cereus group sp. Bce015]